MGVKNNTKYFKMQREYGKRCARLNHYKQALKLEEQYASIYNKSLNKFKLDNPSPSETLMRRFNSQFTRGKNDQLIRFYQSKINNLQKM